jgi:hypothetical protein
MPSAQNKVLLLHVVWQKESYSLFNAFLKTYNNRTISIFWSDRCIRPQSAYIRILTRQMTDGIYGQNCGRSAQLWGRSDTNAATECHNHGIHEVSTLTKTCLKVSPLLKHKNMQSVKAGPVWNYERFVDYLSTQFRALGKEPDRRIL